MYGFFFKYKLYLNTTDHKKYNNINYKTANKITERY